MIDLAFFVQHAFKRCSRCGELKLAFPEWFCKTERASGGLRAYCMVCAKAMAAHYYKTNRNRIRQARQQHRHSQIGRAEMTCEKARRKAKLAGAEGDITANEWKQILDNSSGCYWCGEPFIDDHVLWQLTMDHKTPMSRGGFNNADNVVTAHHLCNSKKQNRLPSEIPDNFFEAEGKAARALLRYREWLRATCERARHDDRHPANMWMSQDTTYRGGSRRTTLIG